MTRDNDELSEHRTGVGSRSHHQRTYEDEHQLRLYEEKLKKTLYEEYLLRLERERLERKLSKSGLLDERIRERSISQEGMSPHRHLLLRGEHRVATESENMRHHTIRERNTQSLEKDLNTNVSTVTYSQQQQQPSTLPKQPQCSQQKFNLSSNSHTSSYKNIKFTRVTDEIDLERLNSILNNPHSEVLDSKDQAEKISKSLAGRIPVAAASAAAGKVAAVAAPTTQTKPDTIVVPVAATAATNLLKKSTSSNTVIIRIKPIINNTDSSVNTCNNNNTNDLVNEQYFAIIRKDNSCGYHKNNQTTQPQQFDRISADRILNVI